MRAVQSSTGQEESRGTSRRYWGRAWQRAWRTRACNSEPRPRRCQPSPRSKPMRLKPAVSANSRTETRRTLAVESNVNAPFSHAGGKAQIAISLDNGGAALEG